MKRDSHGRKQVDLFALPRWAQWVIYVATVVLVGGLALIFAAPDAGTTVPIAAVVAAVIAFAFVAWRGQHR